MIMISDTSSAMLYDVIEGPGIVGVLPFCRRARRPRWPTIQQHLVLAWLDGSWAWGWRIPLTAC